MTKQTTKRMKFLFETQMEILTDFLGLWGYDVMQGVNEKKQYKTT